MDTNDWTTEEITNVANECCDGLEEILRRNEIDATKPFYVDNKYQILRQLPDVSYSQRLEGSKKTINA